MKHMEPCKLCKEEIRGFDIDGYCEDCLCTECGSPLSEFDVDGICAYCNEQYE